MSQTVDLEQAKARAQMIFEVQGGQITVKDAALKLGVSQSTYYRWQKRALAMMIEALAQEEDGEPLQPNDPETEKLKAQKQELEKKILRIEQAENIRRLLGESS